MSTTGRGRLPAPQGHRRHRHGDQQQNDAEDPPHRGEARPGRQHAPRERARRRPQRGRRADQDRPAAPRVQGGGQRDDVRQHDRVEQVPGDLARRERRQVRRRRTEHDAARDEGRTGADGHRPAQARAERARAHDPEEAGAERDREDRADGDLAEPGLAEADPAADTPQGVLGEGPEGHRGGQEKSGPGWGSRSYPVTARAGAVRPGRRPVRGRTASAVSASAARGGRGRGRGGGSSGTARRPGRRHRAGPGW